MSDTDRLVSGYLKRLGKALADLPQAQRREIVQEVSEHIDDARADLGNPTEAEVRNILERVGDPTQIAAEARERFGVQPKKSGAMEVAALILLPIGGIIVPILGWLVGVILLWMSDLWNTREKLVGTLVLPGGLAFPLYLAVFATSGEPCVSSGTQSFGPGRNVVHQATDTCADGTSTFVSVLGVVGAVILIIAPLVTTGYLAYRMKQRSRASASPGSPSPAT
jgi:hypothetical protein